MRPSRRYPDPIVYWGAPLHNGQEKTYAEPIQLYGKVEQKTELFNTPSGEQIVSAAVVYSPIDFDIDGRVFFGVLGDLASEQTPNAEEGAYFIKGIAVYSSRSKRSSVRKIWVI